MAGSIIPFPLRAPTDVHEAARLAAAAQGVSLNQWYVAAAREKLGWTEDDDGS